MSQTNYDQELARIRAEYHYREATPTIAQRYHPEHNAVRLNLESLHHAMSKTFTYSSFSSLVGKRLLDIGCGNGSWLRRFVELYEATPELCVGMDLMEERIASARAFSPEMEWHVGSAHDLPFADASFDYLLCFTLFSSILNKALSEAIAREMWRVLAPGGVIFWYDFSYNNPRNAAVHGISKRRIKKFFPDAVGVHVQRITLAPPLSRTIAPYALWLARFLERCKILNTHLFVTIQKSR